MVMMKYKIARQGQIIGEYDASSVQLLINSGNLMVTDHAWAAGMDGWKQLRELGYAFPVAQPPALPRATPAPFIPPSATPTPPALPTVLTTEQWRSMSDGPVPAACPKCASSDVRSFGILYQQGAHTSTSVGMTLSGQVGGMVTSGQTQLAASTQPPQRGSDSGAVLVLIGFVLGVGLYGLMAYNFSSVVAVTGGAIYLGVLSSNSVDLEHAKQTYRWKNSWCCLKCGYRFMSLHPNANR
jgi:hypothetical protein